MVRGTRCAISALLLLCGLAGQAPPPNDAPSNTVLDRAQRGDHKAELAMAQMSLGQKRYSSASKWCFLLAQQGIAYGQMCMGWLYQTGNGVPQDYALALKMYMQAAKKNDAAAQHDLAYLYEHGLGVPANVSEALKWYGLAAKNGDTSASRKASALQAEMQRRTPMLPRDAGTAVQGQTSKAAPPSALPSERAAANPDPPTYTVNASSSLVEVKSKPGGADVEIDGSYVGTTGSTFQLTQGDHTIVIHKAGYKEWQRRMKVIPGNIRVLAELEKSH